MGVFMETKKKQNVQNVLLVNRREEAKAYVLLAKHALKAFHFLTSVQDKEQLLLHIVSS